MKKVEDIVTDEELEEAFLKLIPNSVINNEKRRKVIKAAILSCASGYYIAHTAKQICKELELVKVGNFLTKKGQDYLYSAFKQHL